jgi:hypothetical protein
MIPLHSQRLLYYGKDEPLPERIPLRAGPLSMFYENGDLRYIRLGNREVIRRWTVAARDRNWGTAPSVISNVRLEIEKDSFRISYECENLLNDIDFWWQGSITGSAFGAITFTMDGAARKTFLRNRLGFCILHPMQAAGAKARIEHVDGSTHESQFPERIASQLVIDGEIKPVAPFEEMRALSHEIEPGMWANLHFDGDIFEMEDQRNWTDASFKTYCTPLRIPFPVEVAEGERVVQSVTMRLSGTVEKKPRAKPAKTETELSILAAQSPLPRIGFGVAGHGQPLSKREIERLALLKPAHLRVDLALWQPDYADRLKQAAHEANALGAQLEIGLFLSDDAENELGALIDDLPKTLGVSTAKASKMVCRWLIFHRDENATSEKWIRLARERLGQSATIFSGTNIFFTQLNSSRPDAKTIRLLDGLCYAFNPQVHGFDNATIAECAEAQAETVRTARTFSRGLLLAITQITLKPRFKLSGVGPEPADQAFEGDPRQMSLFGAGWTACSLKYVSQAGGVESVTYYETTGRRGVMGSKSSAMGESPWQETANGVYPMVHVFADAAEFAGGTVARSRSTEPLKVDGIVLRKGRKTRAILANPTDETQTIIVNGVGARLRVRRLDETNVESAMKSPEAYRADQGELVKASGKKLRLELMPYALARIDF